MRYGALAAAIDWLCATFGFETHRVLTADDGRIVFAQLTFGPSMILLGPVPDSEIDAFMKQPDEVGSAKTQSCYLVVDDIAAHRARVEAAGPKSLSICGTSHTAVAVIPAAIRKVNFGPSAPTSQAKFLYRSHRCGGAQSS